jgi:putative tryptophan/tyrosine transport system substrate-binding protein
MRLAAIAFAFWLNISGLAFGQQPRANLPVIGWLNPFTKETLPAQILRNSLAKHGLVEDTSIRLEIRLADGNPDRLPALAEELVRAGATVIFASGETAARAAQQTTQTIPIVTGGDDLVGSGLVASLARPGGNTTGVSILATELDSKRIEVLKELLPHAKRFGVLNDPQSSGPERPRAIAETARRLDVALQVIDVRGADDLETAFRALQAGRADAVNVVSSATLFALRPRIGALSLATGIPAICQFREMVEAGCLASYGIELVDLYGLLGDQIAQILKGAKPADLPVIQPSRFDLTVNLKTAKVFGITVPSEMLARAVMIVE